VEGNAVWGGEEEEERNLTKIAENDI